MKKMKILIPVVFAILFFAVIAPVYGQASVSIGLKGGLNFSTLSGTTSFASAYDKRTGYHFGAYTLFKFTKIGIQPELLFSKQGQQFTVNTQNYESNFDYISIPVMFKFYLAAGFNLQAGPQFSFLTSAKGDVINTSTNGVTTGQDLKNFAKSTDFSMSVGAGWDLPMGLNIAARYNIGITDVNQLTGQPAPPAQMSSMGLQASKNQVIQVSVGLRLFKLGN
jgi:hypothetical protein